jgi:hypothetical protein
LESFPYRVVTSFRRPGRMAPGPASSRFSAPTTTSLGPAPIAVVRPGPPRFRSQVFSTSQRFPGTSELGDLVSCRRRPWGSPFRALLLAGIACASRRRLLPCSSPPSYLRCGARDLVLRVSPTAALVRRGGLVSPRSSDTVSAARFRTLSRTGLQRLPRRPGPHAPESPRSGGFGCFEALLLPRVRAHGAPLSRTHRGRCSPGLCPSRALIRSSLGPSHDPADHSVRRRLVTAVAKGATPRRQVRPERPCGRHDLVGVRPAGRLRISPCRLSAAVLPPSTLEPPG